MKLFIASMVLSAASTNARRSADETPWASGLLRRQARSHADGTGEGEHRDHGESSHACTFTEDQNLYRVIAQK